MMVMILLLVLVSQYASGVKVEVNEGVESVLLPCQVPADVGHQLVPDPTAITAAVWDRKEIQTVHVRLWSGDVPDLQNDRYTGRTSMRADALQTGDLSLTLRNPTGSDSGTYTCTTRSHAQDMSRKDILLKVKVSQHASVVEVYEGEESVLLLCQVPVFSDSAVVWDHSDSKPSTVHVRLQSGDDLRNQSRRYTNRTSMRADALQTGDLSLTLRNPTGSDSGTYTCATRRFGREMSQTEVQLKVKERPPLPVWCIVLLVLLIPLAAVVFIVYSARERMKIIKRLQPQILEVIQGQKSVQLRFTTKAELPQGATVKWRLTEPKHTMAHVYESGKNQPDQQDKVYRGRTEMDKEPLRTGDLSLKLKDLQLSDSGVYTCTVYNEDGGKLKQKVMTLIVRVPWPEIVEVTQEKKSVLLPFQTTANLPQKFTVEWRFNESKYMKVHVYERGTNHPDKQDKDYKGRTEMDEERLKNKDLSLTLKDLQLTDSGVYTCTVYNEDGLMLLQKSVRLRVRDPEMEVMSVIEGQKSVLLPFQTENKDLPQKFTVEWRLKEVKDMKVYVYERGTNRPDKQDLDYRGRTEMKEARLRTGVFSLTLKDLQLTDSGVYTCTVSNEDGLTLLQKSVTLSVIGLQPEIIKVTQGEESVLLPFKTTPVLPADVTVEWKLTEPKGVIVHVYERGTNHPEKQHPDYNGRTEMDGEPLRTGCFSLKLKKPRLTDSGVYTCTICDNGGHILLQKSVALCVKEHLLGTMKEMLSCSKARRQTAAPRTEEVRHGNQEDVPLMSSS